MKDCIFCKIVSGEIPCHKVWEDENFLVILDAFPTIEGQVLIFPKKHLEDCLFDLENEFYLEFFRISKKIANALQLAFNPIKVGLVVEGLEIDHVHLKLYPLGEKGLVLNSGLKKPSEVEMKDLAKRISGFL